MIRWLAKLDITQRPALLAKVYDLLGIVMLSSLLPLLIAWRE